MKKVWTNEIKVYLKKIYHGKSNQEIANLINEKFSTDFSKGAVNAIKQKMNLKSNYKRRPKYSDEIIEYLKQNHQGKSLIELANEISDKFGIVCTTDNINNLKSRIKKKEGFVFEPARNDGCIKKGNIPMNKGKRWDEYLTKEQQEKSRKTTFKKGHKSANAVDIGEEHMRYSGSNPNDQGYLYVKVCDGRGNKNWKPKHVYIYEQNYGPIPKNHKVIFADGNRFNFDIDNLVLVSNAQELIMNRNKLRFENKELTKTGAIIAKVMDKTYKLKNDRL